MLDMALSPANKYFPDLRPLQSACIQGEGRALQRGSVKVILPSAKAAVNERQVEWLRTFAAALRAMRPAKSGGLLISTGSHIERKSRHVCKSKEAWHGLRVGVGCLLMD